MEKQYHHDSVEHSGGVMAHGNRNRNDVAASEHCKLGHIAEESAIPAETGHEKHQCHSEPDRQILPADKKSGLLHCIHGDARTPHAGKFPLPQYGQLSGQPLSEYTGMRLGILQQQTARGRYDRPDAHHARSRRLPREMDQTLWTERSQTLSLCTTGRNQPV